MLAEKKNLARISATPGKTQLINHYEVKSTVDTGSQKAQKITWSLVDLPGYGFAVVSQKKRRNWEQMIEGYIRKRTSLVNLFVLIDSRHEPQKKDLDFINQLGEWQIPFSVVFTKADKNKPGATQRNVNAFLSRLMDTWSALPKFFVTSALKNQGREELVDYIGEILLEQPF